MALSPSPICTVQDGSGAIQSTTNGANVTAGNTITIRLADPSGVNVWELDLYGQDESVAPPTVTVDYTTKTATFTAPAAPWSLIYRSRVNRGKDVGGVTQTSYTSTFKIATLTTGGYRLAATNETTENSAAYGWTPILNAGPRGGGGGGGDGNAISIQSVPVLSTSPSSGQSLVFNGTSWAPSNTTITAGAGLTETGTTLDVIANADASIVVNANDIQVGVLATDAQHGVRGGGTQHAAVTTSVNGFMSAADKTKLNGITAGAAVAAVTGTAPIVSSGGTSPAISITAATTSAAGSLSAADKTKLDALSTVNGFVFIQPIGGTSSDTNAVLTAATAAGAAGKALVMLPGNANEPFLWNDVVSMPSNVVIMGTPATHIKAGIGASTTDLDAVFRAQGTLGTTSGTDSTTLFTAAVSGSFSIPLVANIVAAGDVLYIVGSSTRVTSQHTVKSVSGSGPYTVTLERPLLRDYASGSTVQKLTNRPTGIRVIGNGMTISGTAGRYICIRQGFDCVFSGLRTSTADGLITALHQYSLSFGCLDCKFVDIRGIGGSTASIFSAVQMESCERCTMQDCSGSIAALGLMLFDCNDCQVVNCEGYANGTGGLEFTNGGTEVISSQANRIAGGSYYGNGTGGSTGSGIVLSQGAVNNILSGVSVRGQGTGIQVTNSSTHPNNGNIFQGIIADDCASSGIQIQDNSLGNVVVGGTFRNSSNGILVMGASDALITGCTIESNVASSLGVQFQGTSRGSVSNIRYKSTINAGATHGVGNHGTGNILVDGCVFDLSATGTGTDGAITVAQSGGSITFRRCRTVGTSASSIGLTVVSGATADMDAASDFTSCTTQLSVAAGGHLYREPIWPADDTFLRTINGTLTAARSYTLPDTSGTFALVGATQTLTNKSMDGLQNTFTNLPLSSLTAPTSTGVAKVASGNWVSAASLVLNADVDPSAAIAGTKISPNFGSQAILTSGTLGAGAATLTGATVSALSGFGSGNVVVNNAGTLAWQAAPNLTLAGDVSGTIGANHVDNIKGNAVNTGAAGNLLTGQVLKAFAGSTWVAGSVDLANSNAVGTSILGTANQASQAMGGDVSGTTASATVAKINGASITTIGGANTVPQVNGAGTSLIYGPINLATSVTGTLSTGNQAAQAMGGDVSGTTAAATVAKINGASVTTIGGARTVLQVNSAGTSIIYAPIDLSVSVTGTLSAGNQASQSMGGDVSGTTAAANVGKINGATVGALGANGTVMKSTGSAISFGAVDLSNSAAVINVLAASHIPSLGGGLSGTINNGDVAELRNAVLIDNVGTPAAPGSGGKIYAQGDALIYVSAEGFTQTIGANGNGTYFQSRDTLFGPQITTDAVTWQTAITIPLITAAGYTTSVRAHGVATAIGSDDHADMDCAGAGWWKSGTGGVLVGSSAVYGKSNDAGASSTNMRLTVSGNNILVQTLGKPTTGSQFDWVVMADVLTTKI